MGLLACLVRVFGTGGNDGDQAFLGPLQLMRPMVDFAMVSSEDGSLSLGEDVRGYLFCGISARQLYPLAFMQAEYSSGLVCTPEYPPPPQP